MDLKIILKAFQFFHTDGGWIKQSTRLMKVKIEDDVSEFCVVATRELGRYCFIDKYGPQKRHI